MVDAIFLHNCLVKGEQPCQKYLAPVLFQFSKTRPHNVYCITNLVNGKIYVGYTSQTLRARWVYGHLYRSNKNGKTKFERAIRKHGHENFKMELVSNWATATEALCEEVRLIAEWGTRDGEIGYNIEAGGITPPNTKGIPKPLEFGKKISAIQTGRKRSAETCRRISEGKIKAKKRATPEERAACAERARNRKRVPWTIASREKMSATKRCSERRKAENIMKLLAEGTVPSASS